MPSPGVTATIQSRGHMKKNASPNGRKHGVRSKVTSESRLKTTLTFKPGFQAYHWFTDRSRARVVIKH